MDEEAKLVIIKRGVVSDLTGFIIAVEGNDGVNVSDDDKILAVDLMHSFQTRKEKIVSILFHVDLLLVFDQYQLETD